MTSRDFVFWMQGFFEISDAKSLNEAQTKHIREHLALVLEHDPQFQSTTPPPPLAKPVSKFDAPPKSQIRPSPPSQYWSGAGRKVC